MARTLNLCLPFFSFLYFAGDPHGFQPALSNLHSNATAPSALKVKTTVLRKVFAAGPLSMTVFGASKSTVNDRVAVAMRSAALVARTRNVQSPSARGAAGVALESVVHGPKAGLPWSNEHSTF